MSFFTAHRITAIIVLVAAAGWVITGEFSAVGSQEVKPAEGEAAAEAAPAATAHRTVAAVAPVFTDYAREIRISGATEADKLAVLAARASVMAIVSCPAQARRLESTRKAEGTGAE